jgi:hypothetical protein
MKVLLDLLQGHGKYVADAIEEHRTVTEVFSDEVAFAMKDSRNT